MLQASFEHEKYLFMFPKPEQLDCNDFFYVFNVEPFFPKKHQNVIWLNTRASLRYKRHILHAPKYDE